MEPTAESILNFAADRAQQEWDKHEEPYLLARLSPDLEKEGIHYKDIIGEQRLKEFVGSAPDRVKLVVHPQQSAKIGLIPPDKEFEYEVRDDFVTSRRRSQGTTIDRGESSRRRNIVTNFLQLVSELDDADSAQIQIPVRVLAKLLRER